MIRFRSIDISNCGPFGAEQTVCFPDGLTLLLGPNATGKTTIVDALYRDFNRLKHARSIEYDVEIPRWLVFFDDNIPRLEAGLPWKPLAFLMSANAKLFIRNEKFGSMVLDYIRMLFGEYIGSRFIEAKVSVGCDGAIRISDSNGDNLSHYFQTLGASRLLFLAINAATRKLLHLDLPFVDDSQLAILDQPKLHHAYVLIGMMSQQIIILESCAVMESIGEEPHLKIVYDADAAKSTIARMR